MDAAGLVVSVAGLGFQFFNTARSALKAIKTIRSLKDDIRGLQILFHVEQIKFQTWADQVGLQAETPQAFEQRFQGQRLHYIVCLEILGQICNLTTNHRYLEQEYGLKATDKVASQALSREFAELMVNEPTTFDVVHTKKAQEEWNTSLMRYQKRISVIEQLKWEIYKKNQFNELVAQLGQLNAGLKEILPTIDRNNFDRALVYGQPASTAELQQLVDVLRDIKDRDASNGLYIDAASFKSRVLHEPSPGATTPSLLVDASKVEDLNQFSPRYMTRVDAGQMKKRVLVETKTLTTDHAAQKQVFNARVRRLVALLHSPPPINNYRIFECLGCVHEKDQNGYDRYHLLFALPPAFQAAPKPGCFSLYSMLRDGKTNKTPSEYPLDQRFRLAGLLANSVAYIHAAGWLHRNLNSNNILCMSESGDSEITMPFLGGFSFARFDDPKEVSEIDSKAAESFYHHPEYRARASTKVKYRRSYELYSLGVILVEIALWKRIEVFRTKDMDNVAFADYLRTTMTELVGYYMGAKYKSATMCCLDPGLLGAGGDEGRKLSALFSRRVVRELESCRA